MTVEPLTDLQEIELREERRNLTTYLAALRDGELPLSDEAREDAKNRVIFDIARIDRELAR